MIDCDRIKLKIRLTLCAFVGVYAVSNRAEIYSQTSASQRTQSLFYRRTLAYIEASRDFLSPRASRALSSLYTRAYKCHMGRTTH